MKLTLTLDEVSACAMALLSKAQEAEEEALGCEKLRCASAVEFWQKRAELYRKVYQVERLSTTAGGRKSKGNNEHSIYAGYTGNAPRVQPSGAGKNEAAPAGRHPHGPHGLRAGRLGQAGISG